MKNNISLIAFDLDFTLFDSMKKMSDENYEFLKRAKSDGIELVPTTGRLYDNIYPEIKEMCRYFILSNGSTIYDSREDRHLYKCEIPKDLALKIYEFGDTLPVVYDGYIDNCGYMSEDMLNVLDEYVPDKNYVVTMKAKRTPVPDLKEYVRQRNIDVQKVQFYFKDISLRDSMVEQLSGIFDNKLYVSVSLQSNIEINIKDANKGVALRQLCSILNIPIEQTIGIGDGTNDLSLIQDAGIGVCMINGAQSCRDAADVITKYDCDNSGFARELSRIINYQKIR